MHRIHGSTAMNQNMFTCPKCGKEWNTISQLCNCGEQVLYIPNELKNESFIEYKSHGIEAVKSLIRDSIKNKQININTDISSSNIETIPLPTNQYKSNKNESPAQAPSQSNQKILTIVFTLMGLISMLSIYLKFYPPSFIKNFKNNSIELLESTVDIGNLSKSIDARLVSECFGTEPFWNLNIDNGNLQFKHEKLMMSLQNTTPRPAVGFSESYIALYQGKVIGQDRYMNVILTSNNQCSDNMSEDVHPVTAMILSGSDLYYGCCIKK